MVGQLYLLLYLFNQAEIFPDYKTRSDIEKKKRKKKKKTVIGFISLSVYMI